MKKECDKMNGRHPGARSAIGSFVAISLLFLASCTFIDDYNIDLMQDATASIESSSSVSSDGGPSTSSGTLSSDEINSSGSKASAFDCGKDFIDSRDNAKYATVKIGTQCWFAENLNYNAKNSSCYGDDDSNCEKYGRLYRWTEAQSACPDGTRLPTAGDWDGLLNYLGNPMVAGKYLKDESSWSAAEDAYGFSALPAGYYSEDDEEYVQIEQMAIFWSAAASGTDADGYVLRNSANNIENCEYAKTNKMSVRCLVD